MAIDLPDVDYDKRLQLVICTEKISENDTLNRPCSLLLQGLLGGMSWMTTMRCPESLFDHNRTTPRRV